MTESLRAAEYRITAYVWLVGGMVAPLFTEWYIRAGMLVTAIVFWVSAYIIEKRQRDNLRWFLRQARSAENGEGVR